MGAPRASPTATPRSPPRTRPSVEGSVTGLSSVRLAATGDQTIEYEVGRAGVLVRRAVEGLPHVHRLRRETTCGNRDDRENKPLLGIQRDDHLVGCDCDRVAAF